MRMIGRERRACSVGPADQVERSAECDQGAVGDSRGDRADPPQGAARRVEGEDRRARSCGRDSSRDVDAATERRDPGVAKPRGQPARRPTACVLGRSAGSRSPMRVPCSRRRGTQRIRPWLRRGPRAALRSSQHASRRRSSGRGGRCASNEPSGRLRRGRHGLGVPLLRRRGSRRGACRHAAARTVSRQGPGRRSRWRSDRRAPRSPRWAARRRRRGRPASAGGRRLHANAVTPWTRRRPREHGRLWSGGAARVVRPLRPPAAGRARPAWTGTRVRTRRSRNGRIAKRSVSSSDRSRRSGGASRR